MDINEHKYPQLKRDSDDDLNYVQKQMVNKSNPNNKSNPTLKMFCTFCRSPGHSISMCWKKKNVVTSPVTKPKTPPFRQYFSAPQKPQNSFNNNQRVDRKSYNQTKPQGNNYSRNFGSNYNSQNSRNIISRQRSRSYSPNRSYNRPFKRYDNTNSYNNYNRRESPRQFNRNKFNTPRRNNFRSNTRSNNFRNNQRQVRFNRYPQRINEITEGEADIESYKESYI